MTLTVQPILPHERRHCDFCNKPLQSGDHKTFYNEAGNLIAKSSGKSAQQQLDEWQTNRRVVRITRSLYPSGEPASIKVVFMPDDDRGWDAYHRGGALFCSTYCTMDFAAAAFRAGYRIKRKAAA